MARYPFMRARFFVGPDGVVTVRAKQLRNYERVAIWQRDGFLCRYCGCRVIWGHIELGETRWREATVDHVMPISRGGQNDPANLVTACDKCNNSKGASIPPSKGVRPCPLTPPLPPSP